MVFYPSSFDDLEQHDGKHLYAIKSATLIRQLPASHGLCTHVVCIFLKIQGPPLLCRGFCFTLRKHAHAIYRDFFRCKNKKKRSLENVGIFNILAQNIDCGYTLEPPRRGCSNEYPQSIFRIKNKENRYTPVNQFYYIKLGFEGVYYSWTCFPDI